MHLWWHSLDAEIEEVDLIDLLPKWVKNHKSETEAKLKEETQGKVQTMTHNRLKFLTNFLHYLLETSLGREEKDLLVLDQIPIQI